MNVRVSMRQAVPVLVAALAAGALAGCAGMEVNTGRGNIPGYYIRSEMQVADRAVESARAAGKDKLCPAEFKAAEAARDKAYDVFRACFTEEGAALAREATAKANALCPPQAPAPAPKAPEPPPAPKVVPPPPAPAPPPPAAPTAAITVVPASVMKGQSATLNWKSQNATGCTIQPGIGAVPPQGARTITPATNTTYDLTCSGAGGTAASSTAVVVTEPPAPKVEAPPQRFCKPAIINIQFDTDKSNIKPQFDAELKKLADFLKEFPNARGEISGHTDNVGSKAYNDKLSQSRAESVRKYLIDKFGIAPDRITAKGYGFSKPIADNKTKEGKAQNRRIEANFSCD